MVPDAGPRPRRARQLIPAGLPRRGELIAAGGIVILLVHLVLAPLALVLALAFVAVSKVSRWRLWWLLVPAAVGLIWVLAAGTASALAGFGAGPAAALRDLGRVGHVWHPLMVLDAERGSLGGQFPVALIGAAAEAALIGWLVWLHTDEWAVPPSRPGLVSAARRALTTRSIQTGAVLTRDGCALGVLPSTGAVAELRWAETAYGTLITGAVAQQVTLTGLQVVHGALRRRKPVIVFDPGGDGAIARAVTAACAATGAPVLPPGVPVEPSTTSFSSRRPAVTGAPVMGFPTTGFPITGFPITGLASIAEAGASQPWGHGSGEGREPPVLPVIDLNRVVRERLTALLPVHSAEMATGTCADLTSLADDLRRIGADGDMLVWVPHGELVPAQSLATLLRAAPVAGLSVLVGTSSPAAATELAGLVGTVIVYRVADPEVAATLAARTGTRLLPPPEAASTSGPYAGADRYADAGLRAAAGPQPEGRFDRVAGVRTGAGFRADAGLRAGRSRPLTAAAQPALDPLGAAVGADLMPSPAIPAQVLLTLGQTEFVLAVGPPQRPAALGLRVSARLPVSPGDPPAGATRPEEAL
jgi:hypothetical protein